MKGATGVLEQQVLSPYIRRHLANHYQQLTSQSISYKQGFWKTVYKVNCSKCQWVNREIMKGATGVRKQHCDQPISRHLANHHPQPLPTVNKFEW